MDSEQGRGPSEYEIYETGLCLLKLKTKISFDCLPWGLRLRIIQCFPNVSTCSKVMKAAKALGVDAEVDGLCVHFGPPESMEDLNKILFVIRAKDLDGIDEDSLNPYSVCC